MIFFYFKWNSSLFVFPIADVAKMQKFKWNSSLAEMSSNWNSSLLETRRLFP
jgi:hypothetical protein